MGLYSERIFPWMLDRASDSPLFRKRRARLVAPAEGDVLEIGFGTGQTLPFYDRARVRSLAVVEPSAGMNRIARARIEQLGWAVRVEALAGEDLPFADASFDCVVACLTLCTVSDPARVLAEIWRVLRPGGQFRFFEHVASEDPACRKWQDRLNPLQKVIGVGCNLNRETADYVRAAGFELGETPQQVLPGLPFAKYLPMIEGVARKPL